MCGHVGIAGRLALKDEGTLKRLLLLDYFRGPDSTGLAAIRGPNHQTRVEIAKIASNPLDLFDTAKFKRALVGATAQAFIGHNRAATKGAITNVNAHPFHYGNIVGAHNGTLAPSSFNELKDKLGETYEVDSEAIIASIARFGIEETVSMMQGAWSLVWFDLDKNTINFLRNKERPMWLAYSAERDKIYWASEYEMIQAANHLASERDKFKLYVEDKTNYQYWETKTDEWMAFDMEALLTPGESRPKPKCKTLKGKEVASSGTGTGMSDPFGNNNYMAMNSDGTSTTRYRSKGPRQFVSILCNKIEPFGNVYDVNAFNVAAKNGCAWCGGELKALDEGVVIFTQSHILLCPKCSNSGGKDEKSRLYEAKIFTPNLDDVKGSTL